MHERRQTGSWRRNPRPYRTGPAHICRHVATDRPIDSPVLWTERLIQSLLGGDSALHFTEVEERMSVVQRASRRSSGRTRRRGSRGKTHLTLLTRQHLTRHRCRTPSRGLCWIGTSVRVTEAVTFTCSEAGVHTQRWVTFACPRRGIVHSVYVENISPGMWPSLLTKTLTFASYCPLTHHILLSCGALKRDSPSPAALLLTFNPRLQQT